MNALTPHTQSAELLRSFHRGLPTERLPVPVMVERLKEARADRESWQFVAQKSCVGSKAEADASDEAAACDDREALFRTAIKAAIDVALKPIGLTFAALSELDL